MFLIFLDRVIIGADGFIKGPRHLGSQIRVACFGLNIAIFWGDNDPDGNGYEFNLGFYHVREYI